MKQDIDKLRFPIGIYSPTEEIRPKEVEIWVNDINQLPTLLKKVLTGINTSDLEKTYRPGSWTVRQLIHHIADSHMNAYSRMKRTLTEELPTILPYDEKKWALLDDVSLISIETSIAIIEGVHERLSCAISDLSISELNRQFRHMDFDKPRSMAYLIGMYSWHGRHHLEHLRIALK